MRKTAPIIITGECYNSYYEKIGGSITCIDEEIPFDIPNSWCWSRLSNIATILDNERVPVSLPERTARVAGKRKNQLYPYYGATGITGYIDDYIFDGEYILLGEDGAPFLDQNATKAYVVTGKCWVNNHAHILKSSINTDFFLSYLNSMNYTKYVHGTTRLKLTQYDMCQILVPVAPYQEQQKISKKVCGILACLNDIKVSLN